MVLVPELVPGRMDNMCSNKAKYLKGTNNVDPTCPSYRKSFSFFVKCRKLKSRIKVIYTGYRVMDVDSKSLLRIN
jgi:hypothetical protein